jgi:hypothetical protein
VLLEEEGEEAEEVAPEGKLSLVCIDATKYHG